MLLYSDIFNGDEMFSDAFKTKEVDGIVYEVDCQMINIEEGNVDIGANASAEEAEEALESSAQRVNNVIYSHRLQQTSFGKKQEYLVHLKEYMKAVKQYLAEHNPDEVSKFEKGAADFAKKIVSNFKDYEFYAGENYDPGSPGMVALLNYREDGITPYFTFWKHGLKEVKL